MFLLFHGIVFFKQNLSSAKNHRTAQMAKTRSRPKSHSQGILSQRIASGALEGVRQLQDAAFAELPSEDLHAYRQAGFRPAGGD
jgi:hypothetical protein